MNRVVHTLAMTAALGFLVVVPVSSTAASTPSASQDACHVADEIGRAHV